MITSCGWVGSIMTPSLASEVHCDLIIGWVGPVMISSEVGLTKTKYLGSWIYHYFIVERVGPTVSQLAHCDSIVLCMSCSP